MRRSLQFASKAELDSWMGRMRPRIHLVGVRTQRRIVYLEGVPRQHVSFTVTYEERARP